MLEASDGARGGGGSIPEELAAEYLARKAAGEAVDLSEFLAGLPSDAARKEFQDLIADAGHAERGLPRTVSKGSLLAERYRILEAIGSGGMGRVFSAIDERLGCKVAIKVLAPLAEGNREREEMFQKESRLLADLKHPGIVAVHDAGRDGEFTYIVMDLVEGLALSDVLDRARRELERSARGRHLGARDGALLARAIGKEVPDGRRDLVDPRDWYRSCARILLEISRTLEAAHGRQVVHRDLKPANVMLLGGGNPIVLDFGLAGSPNLSTAGVTEGLYGSVAYLAPEQAKTHQVGMDPRTDVYQLGLILYEMLTLRRAFPGAAIGEVLKHIEQGFFEAPRKLDPSVPRDLEAICTMALEVSPERRYDGARALREDLELWLEGRAPIASRSARWRTLTRTARYTGRRHPVIAAAAGMALVGLGVATWAWTHSVDADLVLQPYRFDLSSQQYTPLPGTGEEVHANQWLGVNIHSNHENYVYTLSVFGPEGEERRVSPWRTRSIDDLDRDKRPGEPWGLRVPKGERNLLCSHILDSSEPGSWEGLLVLASPVQRPELEEWMSALRADPDGMPYAKARNSLLDQFPPRTRGVEGKGSFTSQEREILKRILATAGVGEPGRRLGLPGVTEREVECRVAGK
jgi:serine/threonine protein kinase